MTFRMSKEEKRFGKITIRNQFTRLYIIIPMLITIIIFIFSKYQTLPIPIPLKKYLHQGFSGNDTFIETLSEHQYGDNIRACAQQAVLTDIRQSATNQTAREPYTGRDLLKMVPPPYLPNYKNPCWEEGGPHRLRCLPYFLLAGAAKCGTTNLYWSLGQHPQTRLPRTKEPQWWWRTNHSPLEKYMKVYDATARSIRREYKINNGTRYHSCVTGDGSPSTSFRFFRWESISQNKNCTGEPGVVIPHLVKHIIPQAKIIFTLRNPADRLRSGYIYFVGRNPTGSPEHFHELCVMKLREFRSCRKLHSDRHCAYNRPSLAASQRGMLQRSLYAVFIKEWLSVFPREQIHFVRFEDFVKNKADVRRGVFKFLELDPVNATEMERVTTQADGIDPPKFKMAPMLNKTRLMLEDFFKPYNEELSVLIGDPRFKFLNT